MFNSASYGKWQRRLKQLLPDDCTSRLTNFVLLMVGILESKSVYLSVVARTLPIRAKKLSLAKRLERFVDNQAVEVEQWYHPWASWLIASASSGGQLHLVIDSTKVSAHCRLVMVAVAYQRRTLPIIWDWVEHPRGHCTTQLQLDLLQRLYPLLVQGVPVSLVGDSEFGNPLLIELLQAWGWDYVLRQKGRMRFRAAHSDQWQRIDAIPLQRGQLLWLGHVALTETHACSTHLALYWKAGEKDPWYLATNQLSGGPTVGLYRRRMWIEEMFGDMKGHGFDLELSRLRSPQRLSRLTLAVCILYVWLVTTGEYVLRQGLQAEIDRTDRQDLSIFRLGWDWLERRLALNDPFPVCFRPNFCLVSGR
jgi:hypothetical protein